MQREINFQTLGSCPECGQYHGYLNDKNGLHWAVCHDHKLKWFIGQNLFGPEASVDGRYRHDDAVAEASDRLLRRYKAVVPAFHRLSDLRDGGDEMQPVVLTSIRLHPEGSNHIVIDSQPGPSKDSTLFTVTHHWSQSNGSLRVFWEYEAAAAHAARLTERHHVGAFCDQVGKATWQATTGNDGYGGPHQTCEINIDQRTIDDDSATDVTLIENGDKVSVATFTSPYSGYGNRHQAAIYAAALKEDRKRDRFSVKTTGDWPKMPQEDNDDEIPF